MLCFAMGGVAFRTAKACVYFRDVSPYVVLKYEYLIKKN